MADSIFAAASTTGVGSSERIASEFMSQGAPSNPSNVTEGSCLGGYDIMTPRVGTGFIQWAIEGHDLTGTAPAAVTDPNYDKHGDWMFDKKILHVTGPRHDDEDNYRDGGSTQQGSAQGTHSRKKGK